MGLLAVVMIRTLCPPEGAPLAHIRRRDWWRDYQAQYVRWVALTTRSVSAAGAGSARWARSRAAIADAVSSSIRRSTASTAPTWVSAIRTVSTAAPDRLASPI